MNIQETIEELRKLKDDLERISDVYDIRSNDTVFVLNKAIIACEQLRKYRKKAKRWKRKYLKAKGSINEDKIRIYTKVYADLEPSEKAEKLYQICEKDELEKIIEYLAEYCNEGYDDYDRSLEDFVFLGVPKGGAE